MNRKEQLLKWGFDELQSTEEYKHFVSEFVTNKSLLMNSEVRYILKKSIEDSDAPFSYDDLDLNVYDLERAKEDIIEEINQSLTNEELNDLDKTKDELIKELNDLCEDIDEYEDFTTNNLISFDRYSYEEQAEVYQWFIMDDRLLQQLEQRNEIVLNDTYWGRQCSGQAIDLDGVIIDIFKEWYLTMHWIESKFNLLKEVTK